ncbi:GntR family transcriptional regulator [Amaricoccus sp.]|uniref:GntR family transcriptional regulator n=1 Tax=Amaricoccus sp. TaxID=1872485 RepID=UPI001B528489|nr:GntR family transcriptional regulator [Amaricoccus sp.]MBP7241808.1 GntR family transcriptional regulator [Amaricoccus sp.]
MSPLFAPSDFADPGHGPLYLQLGRRIGEAIASGALAPGDALPSERELAALTGLSRVTVRKAVAALVVSGQLVQRRGSGTFVASSVEKVEQSLSQLTSFSEDMARRGRKVRSVWLERGVFAASPEEMMALALAAGERVARLDRLRLADGAPLAIERATLAESDLPDPGKVGASLYAALRARGRRPVRAVQRISAANLGARDAELLGVAAGVAGLRIERISYLDGGRALEFTRSVYRGDAYDFVAELRLPQEPEKSDA